MKKIIKHYFGAILFLSVMPIMVIMINTRFTELNAQKNSTDSQHEIADISTRK